MELMPYFRKKTDRAYSSQTDYPQRTEKRKSGRRTESSLCCLYPRKRKALYYRHHSKAGRNSGADFLWKNREETLLPGGIRCGARDFWDVILPALAGHSAMRTLYLDYGIPAGSIQECRDENAEFKIRKVTAADLIQGQIVDMTDFQIREQVIKNWDCEKCMIRKYGRRLKNGSSFSIPVIIWQRCL